MSKKFEELKKLIGTNQSRSFTDYLVGLIMKDNSLFDEVWKVFTSLEEDYARKAAWIIMHAVMKKPKLIDPYLDELVDILPKLNHDGEKRNMVKILSEIIIPERLYSPLLEICFKWLNDTDEAIAIRAFSIDVIWQISKQYPDLQTELAASIENFIGRSSPGLHNKGKKMLVEIYRNKFTGD